MEIIKNYFDKLSEKKEKQFEKLQELFSEWNSKINVVSRKDIDHLYERHVLHSLSIAKIVEFKNGTSVLDIGTGGGFPGIPLAIMFPMVDFLLVDSIGKKIKVVNEIKGALGLENVKALQIRAENVSESFDFVISRAVTNLPDFLKIASYKYSKKGFNEIPNGIIYLKGGDFAVELKNLKKKFKLYNIEDFFDEEFFKTKKVVHIY
ncbi:MAG: 16S rRNA (guanine(527)-N(7))-methyltransferase RsmG [Bacteroidales bacterium]|nr:16S rRNA (guanine(527)-N(7))-methyltransferase RsmG [Bacteroidales bacterium]